jgi:Flp pilus assembly protein TadD
VLDWYAGEREAALQGMSQAVSLAPLEPVFYLNLGWFYEQMGRTDKAEDAYRQVLALAPEWASHTFWAQTAPRQAAAAREGENTIKRTGTSMIDRAWVAYQSGDLQLAEDRLRQACWLHKSDPQIALLNGLIAEQRGDLAAARRQYERLADILGEQRSVLSYSFVWLYNVGIHRREGFRFNLVPGFLRLEEDRGQREALKRLERWYIEDGNTLRAAELQMLLEAIP